MGLHSFILWLIYSSLMGSILAGLILTVKFIFKNRMGARWQYLIWFLLILKLLFPYGPNSSISVFNIFNYLTIQIFAENYFDTHDSYKTSWNTEVKSPVTKIVNFAEDYSLSVDRKFLYSSDAVIFGVWFSGMISITAFIIFLNLRMRRILKKNLTVKDHCVISLLEDCKHAMKIKGNPVLFESPVIQSPMLVGATRPHILLPAGIIGNLSMLELRFILLHELAHLKRRDLYVNWLTCFLQIIHWFNPFIWYAFYQMRQDRELACDAYVLSMLRPDEYKSYGAAIISFLERYSSPAYAYTIAGLVSSKAHIKKRIAMIASYQKEPATRVIRGIIFFALMGYLVLTNAKAMSSAAPAGKAPELKQSVTHEDLGSFFQGYDGSFVLLDVEKDHYLVYNDDNSKKRVSPDSTYKIVSSLAGLETGVLTNENTQLKWDGTVYPFEPWNKDQTLLSAIANSVSWYFQKVDSIVGERKIKQYLKQIGYGNYDLSGGMNDFWLESSLKISPVEQVNILRKLYTYEMPFSRRSIDIVKKAIMLSEQDGIILSGKTGTGIVNGSSLNGWFVGYVENEGKVYIFAMNIQGKENADGANAKNITLSILKDKKIL